MLAAHGLHRDTSEDGLLVEGADYDHITEASIKMAVQDVKCKTQVNLVPNRARIDAKLADARQFLAAHGRPVPGGQPSAASASSAGRTDTGG